MDERPGLILNSALKSCSGWMSFSCREGQIIVGRACNQGRCERLELADYCQSTVIFLAGLMTIPVLIPVDKIANKPDTACKIGSDSIYIKYYLLYSQDTESPRLQL